MQGTTNIKKSDIEIIEEPLIKLHGVAYQDALMFMQVPCLTQMSVTALNLS